MDESLIKKIMPHSIEAEQAVIGSMIMDEEAVETALELLLPEDFYGKQYGTLEWILSGKCSILFQHLQI